MNLKLNQEAKNVSEAFVRERQKEPYSKNGQQNAGTVVRQNSDQSTAIKPDGAKEQTLAKDKKVIASKRLPELSGLEIAEQGAWQVKKIRIWKPGEVILDTYKVEDVMSGGMGYVYIAEHQKWKVKMAIKSPNEEMLSDKYLFSRVLREADAWTELGLHPHIAYCYYVRKIEDVPHIFIEYVDGGTLKGWVSNGRCYDLKIGLDIAIQFCHGMEHAHSFGMIHRDIKPENILMTKGGMVKVTDFGLAGGKGLEATEIGLDEQGKRAGGIGRREDNLTTFGTKMGTYDYMAPEQYEDFHNVDKRVDIYSFGVCLYEMLCGRKPYGTAPDIAASAIAKMGNKPPHEPSTLRKDIPNELARLLKKCCELKRDKRYGSFSDLRKELIKFYHELFNEDPPHAEVDSIEFKADGLNNRAVSYLDLGREDDARKCWQQALNEDPQHLEATYNYGYLRWQRAEITDDKYVTQMKDLHNSRRTDSDYWRLLVWIHLERGDLDAVERIQQSEYRIEDEGLRKALEDKNKPVGKVLRILKGHTAYVKSVCFSPDARYAISGSGDKTIRLWDVRTGKEVIRFIGHNLAVVSVCFFPDARYILSGSRDNTFRLWGVETGREFKRFKGHGEIITSVCLSPDGQYGLSGGHDNIIRLWEVKSGRQLRRFEGHTNIVTCVSFSPDGRYLLSGSNDNTIRLWEVESGKELRRFEGHANIVTCVSFSPYGRYLLSGSSDNTIRLWEVESGREVRRFEGHEEVIRSICFSPDGQYILSGSEDHTIRLWKVKNGKEVKRFEGNRGVVTSVCFSPDGQYILSGSEDHTIRLWEVKSGREVRQFKGHKGVVRSVCFSPDGQYILSGSEDHTIRLWKVKSRREIRQFKGHNEVVRSVCFSPDGQYILSGSEDHTIRLWRVKSGKEVRQFEGHSAVVTSVCFSSDGRYALSGSYDKTMRLWVFDWQWEF